MTKLAILTSHPVQYQAPIFREISQQPDIDLKVYFLSDISIGKFKDPGFGKIIKWDLSLLDGYEYEFLPSLGSNKTISLFRPFSFGLRRRLIENKIDALWIHGYTNQNLIRAILHANNLNIKVLFRGESNLNTQTKNPIKKYLKKIFLKWFFQNCDAFLSIGSLNKCYFLDYGVSEKKIFNVPYSVDNIHFQRLSAKFSSERESFRSSLGLNPARPIILYASKFLARKRPMDLLEAYIHLSHDSKKEPYPYLLFVGDGEESTRLKNRTKQIGWESIKFLGFQNQTKLPAFFDLCDVFVLPSIKETWGLIVNEVMNAGKPIIVSDMVGCGPDLVKNGENGFIFPAGNIIALSNALENVLSDSKRGIQMGANSLKQINSWGFKEDIEGLRKALGI